MSIVEAGLSRPPIRLNTFERVHKDPDLRCIYTDEGGVSNIYRLVPKEKAPQLGGSEAKSVYAETPNQPAVAKVMSVWIGKMGVPRSFTRAPTPGDSRSWRSYNEGDMNEDVVKEKIGSDAYRLFGDGLFATPTTRLSLQPIQDLYTQDNDLVQAYSDPMADLPSSSGARPLTQSLRFMSKFVPGYYDFEKIQVPHPERPTESLSFMQYIQNYGRPSEHIIDPVSKASLPIYGVMSVLAAATSLGDVDVLGGTGKNCGLIFLRSSDGKSYGALVVKIDPGFVFSYEEARHRQQGANQKDIPYSPHGGIVRWENLSQDQKDEFLEVKRNALALKDPRVRDYLFFREGRLWQEGVPRPHHFDQIAGRYKKQLEDHLEQESALYADDLTEYEKRRECSLWRKWEEFNEKGDYELACNYMEKIVEIQEKKGESRRLANDYCLLGGIYSKLGQFDQALTNYQQALSLQRSMLGEGHADLALIYNGIGIVYRKQGKYDQSNQWFEKAIEIRGTHPVGWLDPEVAVSYHSLGMSYYEQGQYERAIQLHEKALEIHRLAVGKKPFGSIAANHEGLANCYIALRELDKALFHAQEALQMITSVTRKEHPALYSTYMNLGLVYHNAKQYDQALDCYQRALRIQQACLGENHLDIATSYHNIAGVYTDRGEYDQALLFQEKAIGILRKTVGDDHPDIALGYNNLAMIYQAQEKFDQSINVLKEGLRIQQAALGGEHPHIATSYNNLGLAYISQSKWDQAMSSLSKAYQIRLLVFGEGHSELVMVLTNLGVCHCGQKDYDQAISSYQKALQIQLTVLGENHPDTANIYGLLAEVYDAKTDYNQAIICYQTVLRILHATVGENRQVANICVLLARVYAAKKDYDQEVTCYKKVLQILQALPGDRHQEIANCYSKLGTAYYAQEKFEDAAHFLQHALQMRLTRLGDGDPNLASDHHNLAVVYLAQGDYAQSIVHYKKLLDIQQRTLGERDPSVLSLQITLNQIREHVRKVEAVSPLIKRCNKYSSKRRDKIDAVATLRNLLVQFSRSEIPFSNILQHVSTELLQRSNPIFQATFSSEVKGIFKAVASIGNRK